MIRLRQIANRTAAFLLALTVCFVVFSESTSACTGIYAGGSSTKNGSVYVGRTEDYGPDYGKQFIIVPAADHAEGEMLAYENSEYIKRIASEKLAQIDEYVSNYVLSISRK